MNIAKRETSIKEIEDCLQFWKDVSRGSGYITEDSLVRFLYIFTPEQIKGAMYLANLKTHSAYWTYCCGILQNWKKDLEMGVTNRIVEYKD